MLSILYSLIDHCPVTRFTELQYHSSIKLQVPHSECTVLPKLSKSARLYNTHTTQCIVLSLGYNVINRVQSLPSVPYPQFTSYHDNNCLTLPLLKCNDLGRHAMITATRWASVQFTFTVTTLLCTIEYRN